MRDHSRSSITSGSSIVRRRNARRSVRSECPSTSASRLSSLAPDMLKRSRKRSSCLGLMANTWKSRSSSTSTTGPRGASIATAISCALAPVVLRSQEQNSCRPAPPCVTSRSATNLPSASRRQARCCSIAQSKPTNQRNSSVIDSTSKPWRATATFVDPCTGAQGANLLLDVVAASLPGHRSYGGAHGTGCAW
jgi:hypothetical protein